MSPPLRRDPKSHAVAGFVAGAAAGALNFVFMPRLAPLFPIVGLGPLIALGALYASPTALAALAVLVVIVVTRSRRLPAFAFAVLGCAMGAGVGTVAGYFWFDARRVHELDRAVAYCDALRPKLESFRSERRRFPQTLRELEIDTPRPLLAWTGDLRYRSTREHFELAINTSRGLAFHGARFDSRNGAWVR